MPGCSTARCFDGRCNGNSGVGAGAQAAVGVALFLCLFAAQAGLIVLTPVLSEVADDLDVSTAAAGQLWTVSGLTAGLTAILLGTVGRSLSLRRVLIGGAGGLALASVVSAAAPSFAVLALGQALLGVSVAALLVGGTVAAAEWVPRQHRTRVLLGALDRPSCSLDRGHAADRRGWRDPLALDLAGTTARRCVRRRCGSRSAIGAGPQGA